MEIQRSAIEFAIQHARACAPYECCGVLTGVDDQIRIIRPIRNAACGMACFELDGLDLMALLRSGARHVVGYYHSHCLSADLAPTAADRSGVPARTSGECHLIVSPCGDWVLFRVRGARWTPVPCAVIDN